MKKSEQTIIIKYVLTTNNDDVWEHYTLEDAKYNQYIFGGIITRKEKIKCQ